MNYVCDNIFSIGYGNGSITTSIAPAKRTYDEKNLINGAKDFVPLNNDNNSK